MSVTCTECGDVRNIPCNSSFCGYWPATVEAMNTRERMLVDTLQSAYDFIADEADNRSAAGSDYSDYEREPRELADQISATIAWATKA